MAANNSIPSYLTKEFLKRCLENGLKIPNIEVDDFTISPAIPKGENYTSELLRVSVNYKQPQQGSKQISLILKNMQMNTIMTASFSPMDVVQIEINMYTKMIPDIEKFLGNSTMLAPKCYATDMEAQVLVLADLKLLGYDLGNRVTGLDEAHCKIVMKKIAQLNAGSIYVGKKNPQYISMFERPMLREFNLETDPFMKVFIFNFEQMIRIVKTWPGYETIAKKLEKIPSTLIQKTFENCRSKEGELLVINHGDLWVNNIMFKYEKGSKVPLDAAFVDLQQSYYGSLGNDLNYFLNTSPQFEVLKSKRTELLKVYYETLKTTLEKLNYTPIPTWEQVMEEVRAREFYGLITVGGVFPLVALDRSVSHKNTINSMLDDSPEKLHAMFGSQRMINTLKYTLKRFDELGVLDE